jgi:signal transduction histidine kinase/CheY-like chemotaxis protein/HPt (histidine-containing phosphotransfer) domain-containing protein
VEIEAAEKRLRVVRAVLVVVVVLAFSSVIAIWQLRDESLAIVVALCALLVLLGGFALQRLSNDILDVAQPVLPVVLPAQAATSIPPAVQRELESLRAMQQELIAAKQAAEAATMAKGEFLATMSHEIRTPLNGILPLLDLLLSTPMQADQRDYLVTAHRSSMELLRIVDDILDYSKLEASKLALENVGINLKEIIDSVAHLMERNATAKGLKLSVVIDPGVRLAVRGDPVRIRQVLTNLVSNAIKFTEHGSVTLQLSKRGESRDYHDIVFAVRDTGVGISPQAVEKLFLPFSQADASTTRTHGGTGLGLVISKRLVDLMNGQIGVRSELGKGSVFWFSVPLLKALGDVRKRHDLEGVRCLMLSGDEARTRQFGRMLGSLGMQMQTSRQGVEALSLLRASASAEHYRPELVVVDQESSGSSSAALVQNVLRDPALNHLQLLCIGSEEATTDQRNATRMQFVSPHCSERELRATLLDLLGVDTQSSEAQAALAKAPQQHAEIAVDNAMPKLSGRVLLVEDNPVNAKVAGRLLSMFGLNVDIASDGRAALDLIAKNPYALVLMDCQMPVMDGYTATRERRAQEEREKLPRLPIIAMTANAMAGDREKCLSAGMDEYLTKPLDRRLLAQTLAHWLSKGNADANTPRSPGPPAPASVVAAAPPVDPPSSSTANPLDQSVIGELIEMMGADFKALIDVYVEDAPRQIARLQAAAHGGDLNSVIESAHSLKSSSANLGAKSLAELALRLERDARNGRTDDMLELAQNIGAEFTRVQGALKKVSLPPLGR